MTLNPLQSDIDQGTLMLNQFSEQPK